MINDTIKSTGWVTTRHYNSDMVLIEEREFPNLVVTTGKNFIASRMNGTSMPVMSHVAVGTLSNAALIGNTALANEISRVAADSIVVTNNAITFTATYAPGVGTGSLVEAGIFNAASAGTMLARTVFSPLSKASGDTVIISWTITNS